MKLTYIELLFENVTSVSVSAKNIGRIEIKGVTEEFYYASWNNYMNAIKRAANVMLVLSPDADKKPCGQDIVDYDREKGRWFHLSVFERIQRWNDIVGINLHMKNKNRRWTVKYNVARKGDEQNEYQKSWMEGDSLVIQIKESEALQHE